MTDWESWQRHVDYVVETRGKWFGIGTGDGEPILTLDVPESQSTPEQWMSSEDLELSFPAIDDGGRLGRAHELLVGDALDHVGGVGKVKVAEGTYSLLVALPGEGGKAVRRGGVITHAEARDPGDTGRATEMTVWALNLMDVWNTTPAPSWPISWYKARPYEVTTDESGIEYSEPRLMARIEMSTRTMFTFKHGPAVFVICRLAQESLDARGFTQADPDGTLWVDDPYHVVEVPEVDTSQVISLEARDGMLWETCAGQAGNAGIVLGARLWWPGDPPVRSWELADSSMTPQQVDITPSQGDPYRQVVEQTFPHPMVVLTVKEVEQ